MNRSCGVPAALALGLVAFAGLLPAAAGEKEPTIRLQRPNSADLRATFDVVGLEAAALTRLAGAGFTAEQWTALLAVYTVRGKSEPSPGQPAVAGSYAVVDGVVRFEPRFPLTPGLRYLARFDPSRLPGGKAGKAVTATFELPKPPVVATTVVRHVYPTRDRLPENQLKFYIHFSAPMSRGEAYDHIYLLDAAGKKIERPFLAIGEELWDPTGTRFTLFLDPGRIKRGLKPREEMGPVLEEGKSYSLVIDAGWQDAEGNPLKATYRKPFKAGTGIERPVNPKEWKVAAPPAGSREPLVVRFPEPLDHALLERVLWVTGPDGGGVVGIRAVTDEETCWRFTPEKPWQAGEHHVVAETILEDLAGNAIGRPFEVDVFHPVQKRLRTDTIQLPFAVRAAGR
jgi:hypothetical protein